MDLSKNKIERFTKLMGYPGLLNLSLDKNPISEIEPNAFNACPDLKILSLNHIKLQNYKGDLRFLR